MRDVATQVLVLNSNNQLKVSIGHCCFFFFGYSAGGILASSPGVEPVPPAVEAQSPNHWTARELPNEKLLKGWENKVLKR